jgi:hypothetical protein
MFDLASERPIPGLDPKLFKVKSDGTFWKWHKGFRRWHRLTLKRDRNSGKRYYIKIAFRSKHLKNKEVYLPAGPTILRAFGITRPIGCNCFWKDGDETNCSLDNISWQPKGANQIGRSASVQFQEYVKGNIGSLNPRAKMDEDDVKDARTSFDCGESAQSLADRFGVSISTMRHCLSRRTWKNVLP